jgi:hypothetical protein
MKLKLLLGFLVFSAFAYAQNITQNVKGTITDKISEKPLQAVTLSINNQKTTTDATGKFLFKNIATGRIVLNIYAVGYKPVSIPEILVTAGKEVIIDVALEQDVKALTEVTVSSSKIKKGNASNEFAGSSSRSFSMEEVTRFAGGRNDPSKMVSNFAGVVSSNDSRNDIIVRGNSPSGVLWRLEGVPTPNPNHYATSGTTGGPISALNTNALKTSDFYTGAFPAEYGNANAAVFDIALRTGNADKHEKTVQLNLFSGLELMLEGPLGKAKNGASYMVGYRYSFVQIGQSLGLDVGTNAIPKYQDWVYNIQLKKGKAGKINFFGMGGVSNIDFIGKDTDSTDFYSRQDQDGYSTNNFYVFGAKHTIDISKKTFLRTVVSYASTTSNFQQYQYPLPLNFTNRWLTFDVKTSSSTFRVSSFINTKFNAKWSLRNGILVEAFQHKDVTLSRDGKPASAPFDIQRNFNGNSTLLQAYSQFRFKPTNDITVTGGLHQMYFTLSQKNIIEPRAGISYQINNNNTIMFNYGLHSQMQPLPVYFFQREISPGVLNTTNKNLDFTKAHHFVVGYEKRFLQNWRLKAEAYYQHIFDVPVEKISSGFSMLNAGADFGFPDKTNLQNTGTGSNYGVELTLEKFLSNGFYVLTSSSIFSAKYKGSDGIERNSSFNYGYAANILGGKEWKMGKAKKNAFTIDIKLTTLGGRYATPVDFAASIAQGREILDETKFNADKLRNYFRLDTKFGFRINSSKRKVSHTFYFDLQNVTNQKNIFLRRYNAQRQTIGDVNQIGFFPDLLYRLQF